jgi:hypothetical protein
MKSQATVASYLALTWLEEDDDGINLIIVDERRERLKRQMIERLRSEPPIRVDEHGHKYYSFDTLDRVWADVSATDSS